MLVIDMYRPREGSTTCCVCERECGLAQGIAVYEDVIVPPDAEDWGGAPACWTCYMALERGVIQAGMDFAEARQLVREHVATTVATALHRMFL